MLKDMFISNDSEVCVCVCLYIDETKFKFTSKQLLELTHPPTHVPIYL